jgi:excisionase family DNA binding protein
MGLIDELRQRKTYLSTIEAMELLRVTRNTLCEWVRIGRITAIRRGNGYLFDPHVLADWLEQRTTSRRQTTVAA